MIIDWSMAPEWAEGHGLVAHSGISHVWFNDKQYSYVGSHSGPYTYGAATGAQSHNYTRGQIECITLRPAKPEPWAGEGLPPVGAACEVLDPGYKNDRFNRFIGKTVTVIAHDVIESEPVAVFRMAVDGRPDDQDYHAMIAKCFRPARTPEQIAADEREAAALDMAFLMSGHADRSKDCFKVLGEILYEAGYRKQEVK